MKKMLCAIAPISLMLSLAGCAAPPPPEPAYYPPPPPKKQTDAKTQLESGRKYY
ncbi:MAG: hypothetical protein KGM42_17120 [Hyphomicrobiales bacterium]|nr:hypothetical protein [Hyphomicrobiales bacterium]